MKAVILSGGNGTRLQPLTNKIPKTMVQIGKKPILWYHINHIKSHGIEDIWLALHKFPEVIINYFGNGLKYGVNINYSIEKKPLGTSGALRNLDSNLEKELKKGRFIVVYGDNLTNFNYLRLINFHQSKHAILTLGLFKNPEPWTGGVIETDIKGKILKFVEKPLKHKVKSELTFAGVAVCEPKILDFIPDGFSDFGFDILPKLLKLKIPMYALDTNSYLQDIGNLERLKKARSDLSSGKIKFNWL